MKLRSVVKKEPLFQEKPCPDEAFGPKVLSFELANGMRSRYRRRHMIRCNFFFCQFPSSTWTFSSGVVPLLNVHALLQTKLTVAMCPRTLSCRPYTTICMVKALNPRPHHKCCTHRTHRRQRSFTPDGTHQQYLQLNLTRTILQ